MASLFTIQSQAKSIQDKEVALKWLRQYKAQSKIINAQQNTAGAVDGYSEANNFLSNYMHINSEKINTELIKLLEKEIKSMKQALKEMVRSL